MPDRLASDGAAKTEPASAPGKLSLLLEELARAPAVDLDRAWERTLQPGHAVGRFEILREIGRGGFGVVYAALDRELGRSVAFKTLRPARAGHPLSTDWIRKEAEAVARLDHPTIVTLYDVGRCEAGLYLVEELLRGETLEARVRRDPLTARHAVTVGLEIAKGLAHAHGRGVFHRDLKPNNVFLTEDGCVKLLDFGLAHLLGTRESRGAGTPAYMAPEQALGEAVDARADVFALGVTLFEALTAKRPFEVKEGRSAVLEGGSPSLPASAPAPLARLVERCLSRDPAKRPANGQAMVEELLAIQRSLERDRGAPGGAVSSWLRQHRRARVLGALAVLATAAGAAAMLHFGGDRPRTPEAIPTPPVTVGPPSIAVLPFDDMGAAGDEQYLADGVAAEIRDRLAHVEGLKVIETPSSARFPGKSDDFRTIGRKLDVAVILVGGVRREGDHVRVGARLIRVADGGLLWSAKYDRELVGIFEIQDEIARAVVAALLPRWVGRPEGTPTALPSTSPEAYRQYLIAKQFLGRNTAENHRRAAQALEKALAIDRAYVQAWAALADALNMGALLGDEPPDPLMKRARSAADRAVALAPDSAIGYAARSLVRQSQWDWEGARSDAERAVALDPRSAENRRRLAVIVEDITGKPDLAIGELRKATELDPLSPKTWMTLGNAYRRGGKPALAREAYLHALEIDPEFRWANMAMAAIELDAGNLSEARMWADRQVLPIDRQFWSAVFSHARGDRAAARRAARAFDRDHGGSFPSMAAELHARLGEPDLAFEWLERAFARRSPELRYVRLKWTYEPLHADPRWGRFLAKMKLPVD
jgi:eukaryotic-like serine/threonine-protein kinase